MMSERVKTQGYVPLERTPFSPEQFIADRTLERKDSPEVPGVTRGEPKPLGVPEIRWTPPEVAKLDHGLPGAQKVVLNPPVLPAVERSRPETPDLPTSRASVPADITAPTSVPTTNRGEPDEPVAPQKHARTQLPELPAPIVRNPHTTPDIPVIPQRRDSTPQFDNNAMNRRSGITTHGVHWS